MQHTVVATQLNAKRKYTGYTLVHTWYTTITAVHNIHSGTQHKHNTETFRLPERQVHDFSINFVSLASTLTS